MGEADDWARSGKEVASQGSRESAPRGAGPRATTADHVFQRQAPQGNRAENGREGKSASGSSGAAPGSARILPPSLNYKGADRAHGVWREVGSTPTMQSRVRRRQKGPSAAATGSERRGPDRRALHRRSLSMCSGSRLAAANGTETSPTARGC